MLKGCCKFGLHYFYVTQFYETFLEYFPFDSTSLNLKHKTKSMFVLKKTDSSPLTQPGCSANHIQYFCFIQNLYNQSLKYFTSVEFQGNFSYCFFFYVHIFVSKEKILGARCSFLSKARLAIVHGNCPKQPQVIEQLHWSCFLLSNLLSGHNFSISSVIIRYYDSVQLCEHVSRHQATSLEL